MIQLTPSSKILLGIDPIDFRKGIDGICKTVKTDFELDPMVGTVFVFINRKGTQIRLLTYDGSGFWLCTKRLSKGVFWWPKSEDEKLSQVDAKKMLMVLWGANPEKAPVYSDWRKVS